jgi:hypothetical protein
MSETIDQQIAETTQRLFEIRRELEQALIHLRQIPNMDEYASFKQRVDELIQQSLLCRKRGEMLCKKRQGVSYEEKRLMHNRITSELLEIQSGYIHAREFPDFS